MDNNYSNYYSHKIKGQHQLLISHYAHKALTCAEESAEFTPPKIEAVSIHEKGI